MNEAVLFLQELDLSPTETTRLLQEAKCYFEPRWRKDGEFPVDAVKVLVTKEHHVDASVLEPFPNVEMVSLGFTGHDGVDKQYARSRGIQLYYVPGYATDSVAELNVGLALSILRKITRADRTFRDGHWHDCVYPGRELGGKCVGIVGTGTIGLASARRFHAFGCSLIGFSRNESDAFKSLGGRYVGKQELFSQSDIVVLCLSLNKETRHFVDQPELARMKRGAILLNSARSELVNKQALITALREFRISAGIDVYEEEPQRGFDELLGLRGAVPLRGNDFAASEVVVTPHLGFKTEEALRRLAEETIANIGRFLRGDPTNRLAE